MESQNKPLRSNNIDSLPKYSNIIQDNDTNKRKVDNGYSFALRDVNAKQNNCYNIQNEEAKPRNMDSGFSFAKDSNEKQQSRDTEINRNNVVYDNSVARDRNIWKHRNTSNPDFLDIHKNKTKQFLGSSLETNTSGMTYDVISHTPDRQPSISDTNGSKDKRQAHVNCRKVQAVVIIVVILVLGVVAFFIVRNFIKKGNVVRSFRFFGLFVCSNSNCYCFCSVVVNFLEVLNLFWLYFFLCTNK